jgi:membrane-associated phospholipid phosphatase
MKARALHLSADVHPQGVARDLVGELVRIGLAALAYVGVRAVTEGRPAVAEAHALAILRLERRLGIDWEAAFQAVIVDKETLVALANWVYIYGHWPVIATVAAVLFVRHRENYRLLRNAIFISGAIGFAFFALYPVAPPRLLELGLVDTVAEQSRAYRTLQPPAVTNQYAAMPSLHVGWNLLVGITLLTVTTHTAVRVFAVVLPVAMAFSVVATANHYVLDVVVGSAVVLVGLLGALALRRRNARTLEGSGAHASGRGAVPDRPPRR